MEWIQTYNPGGNGVISTVIAALPIVVLLVMLGVFGIKAQWSALTGLVTAFIIAITFLGMPLGNATAARCSRYAKKVQHSRSSQNSVEPENALAAHLLKSNQQKRCI